MLEIRNIKKTYSTEDFTQRALDDVSINFRKNEFASILGPSGSGKTTLLNIIGGLDKYDSGDLVINEISTKDYKDRDWDNYRNCRIGFVFQSYNLISHQSILFNIELALILSGVSKKERKRRAHEALIKVGLKNHINKKPNQLSGGQMQRVAIARALVNDPDILLADEPTGALDTKTSTQIMNVLKEVAKDKLVIMVTHNEALAKKYSTRIVKLLDGQIVGDTNPYDVETKKAKKDTRSFFRKTSMSFITALQLSFSNLKTKSGRTLLVSFAGSIGIVGIALILSLSNGVNNYINNIQEQTLSSYPFTVELATADITGAVTAIMGNTKKSENKNGVHEIQVASEMFAKVGTNDLKSFKEYLDNNPGTLKKYTNSVEYYYGVDPQIYSYDTSKKVEILNPSDMFAMFTNSISSSMVSTSFFSKMMGNRDLLKSQYDVLAGSWPKEYDEVLLVLNDPNSISDVMVYVLGLRDQEEFMDMMSEVMEGNAIENKNVPMEWSYDDLLKLKFKLVLSADYYKYDSKFKVWTDNSDDEEYLKKLVDNGVDIKISGIVSPKDGNISSSLTPGIAYTEDLINYIIDKSSKKEIVKEQIINKDVDVFSNKKFDDINEGDNKTGLKFEDMISIDKDALKKAFGGNVDQKKIKSQIENSIKDMIEGISTDITPATNDFNNTFRSLFNGLIKKNVDITGFAIFNSDNYDNLVNEYMSSSEAKNLLKNLENKYKIPYSNFVTPYSSLIKGVINSSIIMMGGTAMLDETNANLMVDSTIVTTEYINVSSQMAKVMTEAKMKIEVSSSAGVMVQNVITTMTKGMKVDADAIKNAFKFDLDEEELTRIITTLLTDSDTEYSQSNNLRTLGYSSYDDPIRIAIYFKSFDSKESFKEFIEDYNDKMTNRNEEDKLINYTDVTGILMSSVSFIVDIISYVLIAFVSVSLVVSSIMIGIITYISVLERTKEIGILRSIGASKKDISRVFNAETIIIGFSAGVFGIVLTYLLDIIANIILYDLTNVRYLAELPFLAALILIGISVFLTFIAGLIPARIAAKKDPVEALRTE